MKSFRSYLPGDVIADRFQIQATLGKGKSSTVYKANDVNSNTIVALKVLDPFLAQDPLAVERFRREAKILQGMSHSAIGTVYALENSRDLIFLVMEYYEGEDVKQRLLRDGAFPLQTALDIMKQLLGAIGQCHSKRILHRDIKPANVLINSNNQVKLFDFGISKINAMSDLTKTGTIIGTPEYMAPEMFKSGTADQRSDLYSLGVLMYELLAGVPPYRGHSLTQVMTNQLKGQYEQLSHRDPNIPEWIDAVLAKLLHLKPECRYQSADEVVQDLARASRAIALLEAHSSRPTCSHCQEEIVPGLQFCHMCSHVLVTELQPGKHAVVLSRCSRKEDLSRFLRKQFKNVSAEQCKRQLNRLPIVLIRNVSKDTADAITAELAPFHCAARSVGYLPKNFKMSPIYALIGVLFVVFGALVTGGESEYYRVGVIAALVLYEAIVLGVYFHKTKTLIGFKKRNANPGLVKWRNAVAELFRDLSAPHVKRTVGHFVRVVESHLQKRQLTPANAYQAITSIYKIAKVIESLEMHLNHSSLNRQREVLISSERRLAKSTQPDQNTKLLAARERASHDYQLYQKISEYHGNLWLGLLNAISRYEALGTEDVQNVSPDELDRLILELLAEAEQGSQLRAQNKKAA